VEKKAKRGFAAINPKKQREIASQGSPEKRWQITGFKKRNPYSIHNELLLFSLHQ
jgi:hypothetical protein